MSGTVFVINPNPSRAVTDGIAKAMDPLEHALRVPVIDPCQAATAMALSRIPLKQFHKVGASHAD